MFCDLGAWRCGDSCAGSCHDQLEGDFGVAELGGRGVPKLVKVQSGVVVEQEAGAFIAEAGASGVGADIGGRSATRGDGTAFGGVGAGGVRIREPDGGRERLGDRGEVDAVAARRSPRFGRSPPSGSVPPAAKPPAVKYPGVTKGNGRCHHEARRAVQWGGFRWPAAGRSMGPNRRGNRWGGV